MADEQAKSSPDNDNRKQRRRTTRKRSRTNKPRSTEAPSAPSGRSGGETEPRGTSRRRRRRKPRSQGEERRTVIAHVDMLDARLPESIFVYTHMLRSSELDTYGFRPDPFLNRSRSLDDFRIDLSPLFPENTGPEERIFDAALHGPIVTSAADPSGEDGEEGDGEYDDDWATDDGDAMDGE